MMMKNNIGKLSFYAKYLFRMFFSRTKSNANGGAILGLIFGFVVFGGLVAAVYKMTSSGMMQAVSTNNSLNAYYMAESGFRIAAGYYLNTGDVSNTGMIDDDKADILEKYLNGKTFTIGGKGSVTLDVYPYWLMSTGTGSAKIPGKTPPGFSLPTKGSFYCVGGSDDSGLGVSDGTSIAYTSGSFSHGVFAYQSSTACDVGYSLYIILNTPSAQPLTHDGSLTLALNGFPPQAIMRHNGIIQVGDLESDLFTYKRAIEGNSITLEGIRKVTDPDNKYGWDDYFPLVDETVDIVFKRALILESQGKSGSEERMLRFYAPIQDSNPIPETIEFVPTTREELDAMFDRDGITRHNVGWYTSSGGQSDLYAVMQSLVTTTGTSGSGGNDFKHGTFWFKGRDSVDRYWWLGNNRLSYDLQAKLATVKFLRNGALGVSFRGRHAVPDSNKPDHYYGLSFMRYSLDTLYFQHGSVDIESGDKIEAWTCKRPRGTSVCNEWGEKRGEATVQGMPYLSSDTQGSIRLTERNGFFERSAWLRTADGDFIARVLNRNGAVVSQYNDLIPDKIKPKPTDFDDEHPFYNNRYNIGALLIVLWERRGDEWQWLAFKDISHDEYTRGMQDWNDSGNPPYGSCVSNCTGADGQIINDKASLLVRVREKIGMVGGTQVKYNDLSIFYGDASTRWTLRNPNNIPYDIMKGRKVYLSGSNKDSPFPFWPPERMVFWTPATDYMSHIQGIPETGDDKYLWDTTKPGVSQSIFNMLFDGTIQTSSITTFSPPLNSTYNQHEVGMHSFGDADEGSLGFTDFALKFVFEDAKLYGGFLEPFVQ